MENVGIKKGFWLRPVGSYLGLILTLAIGFLLYYVLTFLESGHSFLSYADVVSRAGDNPLYKLIWMTMNFTEADFYAGFFAGLGLIIGGIVAWRLDVKKSKWAGFDICYGTNLWPWVFASQVLSMLIALYLLNYTHFFLGGKYTWLPTFITIVGGPPALMLIYGPNWRALITGSILGAFIAFPVAFWFMTKIIPVLAVPVVVGNVFTMAILGIFMCQVFKVLPWMKKVPFRPVEKVKYDLTPEEKVAEMSTPTWFVRRVLADLTEAQFYGNEIAALGLLVGVIIDQALNAHHPAYGSGLLPAIILSQFVASAIGVFLYFHKWVERGWYPTFVPVVSVGPACVLAFGGSIWVAVFAGVLGGILGAPYAEYLYRYLPEDFHPTIANVTSMAVSTIIVYVIMQALPWF